MSISTQRVFHEEFDVYVEQVRQRLAIPGIAVGISHQGHVISAGYGVTNIDHPLPVTAETLFQIGSITKTFVGTAVMRLVENGKLDLEAKVRDYLPDFRVADNYASAVITIRHLLTHTGGFVGDYFDDTGPGDHALQRYVENMAELPQLVQPGSIFSYNNAGFSLMGRIMEVVTGQSFEATLRELLLGPLGLEHTYLIPEEIMTFRFASGHHAGDHGAEVARPWALPRSLRAAGGIVCHVTDLLKYASFHLGDGTASDGTRLLSSRSLAEMHTPQVKVWDGEYRGLTWRVDDVQGLRLVSHKGGTVGQVSLLLLIPEEDFALVVLTNSEQGDWAASEISQRLLRNYFQLEISPPAALESPLEALLPYAGLYRRPFADIELGFLAGRLVGQIIKHGGFPTKDSPPGPLPPPMALALCATDRLVVLDGPLKGSTLDALRREDGRVGWLRLDGRLHVREE